MIIFLSKIRAISPRHLDYKITTNLVNPLTEISNKKQTCSSFQGV